MDYIELSKKDVASNSILLAKKVQAEWKKPDAVVFIARGAFLIGNAMADYYNAPLLEIHASRKASKLKTLISPLLSFIPSALKKRLREMEVKSGYHSKHVSREIRFNKDKWSTLSNINYILVVDDSVDTGNTVLAAKSAINEFFPNAEVKIAAFNCFTFSVAEVDFVLWEDTMLNGPWSNDSKENAQADIEYNTARINGVFI